jgi:hypothetical protein
MLGKTLILIMISIPVYAQGYGNSPDIFHKEGNKKKEAYSDESQKKTDSFRDRGEIEQPSDPGGVLGCKKNCLQGREVFQNDGGLYKENNNNLRSSH